ncbi:cytochrome P450 6k1 isoform X2 [Leptinotarsa decemlineata]|nr:cytochrome P450 6k1-like [Leptinotarsa decemlineata]XP_023022601.1 cytochrome P450 6k1-like [Leptinotarsa decemlineata]
MFPSSSNFSVDISICLSTIIILLYLYWTRNFNYWKNRGIPYKKPIPFFGNIKDVLTFRKSIGMNLKDIYDEMDGPYLGIFIMDKPALLLKNLDVIKNILVTDFNNFCDRTLTQRKSDLGSSLLPLMKNPDWKAYRKLLTPAYSSGRIKTMYNIVVDNGVELVRHIAKIMEKTDVMDARHEATLYGAEVITSTAFGLKGDCFEDENSGFKKAAERIFDFNDRSRAIATSCYMMFHSLVHIFRLKFVEPRSEKFLKDEFFKTVKYRQENNITRSDFVDILMNLKKNNKVNEVQMDDEKMVAQAITFFIAGFETTSATISFSLYELAKNPEIQEKVREEVSPIFDEHEFIPYETVNTGMAYTGWVMKETLRKYPPAPHLSRTCLNNYRIPGTNDVIPKGIPVFLPVYALQTDPENYPEPEKFIPERFSPDNAEHFKAFSWLPFGGGPRSCLGERFATVSVKSAIANIIYNFEVELSDKSLSEMEFHPRAFTTAPKTMTLPLRFKKIHRETTKYPIKF